MEQLKKLVDILMNRVTGNRQNDLVGRVEGTGHVYIFGGGRAQSVNLGTVAFARST